MKNRIAKKICASVLAGLMTISLASAAPVWAADAKTMTIGVTSFADTLEPTEQYFSWVISRYGEMCIRDRLSILRKCMIMTDRALKNMQTQLHR